MLVTYRQYSPLDIQEGDIILFRTEFQPFKNPISLLSAAVRFFTQCKYNHSAIVTNVNGTLHIVEAKEEGVISNRLTDVLDREGDKILILRSENVPADVSDRANNLVGLPYDFLNLLLFQVIYRTPKLLFGTYGPWIGPTGDTADDQLVCSEVCGYAHGIPEFYKMASSDFINYPGFYIVFKEPFK